MRTQKNSSDKIKVFAPGSVSNLGAGFDVLGFAMNQPGDIIEAERNSIEKLVIKDIKSKEKLPFEPEKNVATVAIKAMLDNLGINDGFNIYIEKGCLAGSGLGSSAASSVGAVFAVNYLLGNPFSKHQLIDFAMEGEKLVSGQKHADNVAPCLLGGITLIRSYDPLDIIQINVPEDLWYVVVHPQVKVSTQDARNVLSEMVPLKKAVKQWGNLAGLMLGLSNSDYELIGRSLEDHIIESQREHLIPEYRKIKNAAFNAGALGCNISGSGPSVFALTKGEKDAKKVEEAMKTPLSEIDCYSYSGRINTQGTYIVND